MSQTFSEFKAAQGSGQPFKVPSDIAERWQSRIVAQGLVRQGRCGGAAYLSRYGKGIGVAKLIALARTCEFHVFDTGQGAAEMADYFWETAYIMQTGENVIPNADRAAAETPGPQTDESPYTALVGTMMLSGQVCQVCQGEFRPEDFDTDTVIVYGKVDGKFTYAHEACYPKAEGAPVVPATVTAPKLTVRDLPGQVASTQDWTDFPAHLRPGTLVTMQPVDAAHNRAWYIGNPAYCGQPKRDGKRMVIFATSRAVAYQSRSLALWAEPSPAVTRLLTATAVSCGPFILDAELWWPDVAGGEHRTGAQAAQANATLGQPTALTPPKIAIFEALYYGGRDLTEGRMAKRFEYGRMVVLKLADYGGAAYFEFLEPAYSAPEKYTLAEAQHTEGREGEVWRLLDAPYTGGKLANGRAGHMEPIVRTKHLLVVTVRVTGFSDTGATKLVRLFAAIQIADPVTGAGLGSVGTGFTQSEQRDLLDGLAKANAEGKPYLIEVCSQGITEFNKLWHPRFRGIVE
jgi:bifunctional non-homologous end joining protein LigD